MPELTFKVFCANCNSCLDNQVFVRRDNEIYVELCDCELSYEDGFESGKESGYDEGFKAGEESGYNEGYDEGYKDA